MLRKYIIFIGLCFLGFVVRAQQSMMSNVDNVFLDKLIATARANYPKVKIQDAMVEKARLAITKAKLDWLSIVSFTYLYSPNNNNAIAIANPSLLNGYQFGFGTSIGSILQRPVAVKSARNDYHMARLGQEDFDVSLVAQVKQRYYAYVAQQTLLAWRTKTLESAETSLKDIRYKFEKGVESFEHYSAAETSFAATIQFKIESEAAFLTAKSSLEEIIGAKLESLH